MSTRSYISGLLGLMVNALIFGTGVVVILAVPALNAHAAILIPALVLLAFVATPIVSWYIAPRVRARYWRARGMRPRAAFK
ncbi:MAG: hypothetical protein IT548_05320 [Alphaproteobacteria bacterium]|nr:hypothetical protein [Alphaproteobacteria bacterium]